MRRSTITAEVRRGLRARGQEGFTLLEMTVSMALMSLVLVVGGTSLISLTNSSVHSEAMVQNQQAVGFAITQLVRDLRAADPVVADSSTAAYPSRLEMDTLRPNGSTADVAWVYNAGTGTLSRQVISGGAVVSSGTVLTNLTNSSSQPVFSLYDSTGKDLVAAGTPPGTVAICATTIQVHLVGAVQTGPTPFDETETVQLRNQLSYLAAHGSNPC